MKKTAFVAAVTLAGSLVLTAGPASAQTWQIISRSENNVFLLDVDSILAEGDATSAKFATVPRRGEAADYAHSVEVYQFQCGGAKWRTAGMTDYGADGAQADTYPEEGAAWETVRPNTVPDFIKSIVCDGSRASPPHFATVQAFVDAGRP